MLTDSLTFRSIIDDRKQPFDEPKYLALDNNGWLYIADQQNNTLRIFNNRGVEVEAITKAGGKQLNYIEGVEVKNGLVWISDTYNNRIVLFGWIPQ